MAIARSLTKKGKKHGNPPTKKHKGKKHATKQLHKYDNIDVKTLEDVEKLTELIKNNVLTLLLVYADWCGHCKKAKPDFVEFMADGTKTIGSKTVKIEMVNADSGDPKVEAFQVKGYPTFCLQTTDGKITEYKGKREVAGYLEFLNSSLGGV
jgi:thiol-disulfide isomerase/thioredoxin